MSGNNSHLHNQNKVSKPYVSTTHPHTNQAFPNSSMASSTNQYFLMQQQPAQPGAYQRVIGNGMYVPQPYPPNFRQQPQQMFPHVHASFGQPPMTPGDVNPTTGQAYIQPLMVLPGQYGIEPQYSVRSAYDSTNMMFPGGFVVPTLATVQAGQTMPRYQTPQPQSYPQMYQSGAQQQQQVSQAQIPTVSTAPSTGGPTSAPQQVVMTTGPVPSTSQVNTAVPQQTQSAPVQAAQPRKKKIILIEDPATGKAVELPPRSGTTTEAHTTSYAAQTPAAPPVETKKSPPSGETSQDTPAPAQQFAALVSQSVMAPKTADPVQVQKAAPQVSETKKPVESPAKVSPPETTVVSPAKPTEMPPESTEKTPEQENTQPPNQASADTTATSKPKDATTSFFAEQMAGVPTPASTTSTTTTSNIQQPVALKPSKSEDGTLTGPLIYDRQRLTEIKNAAQTAKAPGNIPDNLRKPSFSVDPFDTSNQWNNRMPRSQQSREPNVPPVRRLASRTPEEEIGREVRGILNKLTPENFESMTSRMHAILSEKDEKSKLAAVSDKAKLFNDIVGLIFDKAISEQSMVGTYAKMCLFLNKIEVMDKENKKLQFKKCMLTYCQREFEEHDHGTARQKELEDLLAKAKTPEEKKFAGEDLMEYKFVLKKKYLGNIRFISELYRTKELTHAIITDCIARLLSEQDEETLECLCKLLRTVGKMFEDTINRSNRKEQIQWWKNCIMILEDIVGSRKCSSRIRFFIQDVLDARKDGWVFKQREAEGPKKIADIRGDLEREHAEKERESAKYRGAMSAQRAGNRGGQQRQSIPHIQSSGQLARQGSGRDHELSSDIRSFGPVSIPTSSGTGDGSFALRPKMGWARGAAAPQQASDERRSSGISPSVMHSSAATGYRGARSLEKNREVAQPLSSFSSKRAAEASSVPRSATAGHARVQQVRGSDSSLGTPVTEKISDEKLASQGSKIIHGFFRHLSVDDFYQDASVELAQPHAGIFVKHAITAAIEQNESSTSELAKLFNGLVKSNRLNQPVLVDGLVRVVDEGEDLEVDMPHFWTVFSKLMYDLVFYGDQIEHRIFSSVCSNAAASSVDRLSESFLVLISKQQDETKAASFFRTAGLNKHVSKDFMKKPCLSWLAHQLTGTVDDDDAPEPFSTPSSGSPDDPDRTSKKLKDIFDQYFPSAKDQPNESKNNEVIDEIMKSIDSQTRQSPRFIHDLTNALCSTCLVGYESKAQLSESHLSTRLDVVKRFCQIENRRHTQAVLTGAHELVVTLSRPPNLLAQLFTIFSHKELISKEDFVQWRDSNYTDSRGIDIKNLAQFFESIEAKQ